MQNYVGQQIDRYRIIERLGTGGMAVVYKAYDTRLERDVAIKVIRTESIPQDQHERLLKRFEREAKAQARFHHPNIIPVHDYGEVGGSPYLVMTYVPGGTLKEKAGQPVDYRQAIQWLLPMADALAYAHKRGVIHRDIKPSNILIDEEGQPVLTDFGIAKILETDEATLTGTGLGVGTPEYMAPEQWQGKTTPATDQYALGVVLYELITGQKPYSADTPAAIILMQANEPLRPPSQLVDNIPDALEKALYKALASNPNDRYLDMAAFIKTLEGIPKREPERDLPEQVNIGPTNRAIKAVQSQTPKQTLDKDNESETIDRLQPLIGDDGLNEKETLRNGSKNKKLQPVSLLKWLGLALILFVISGLVIVLRGMFTKPDTQSMITKTENEISVGSTPLPTSALMESIETIEVALPTAQSEAGTGKSTQTAGLADNEDQGEAPIVFFEDFEDGKDQQISWASENWQIIPDETGNLVYDIDNGSGSDFPGINFGEKHWRDYEISFDFRLLDAVDKWVILYFRTDDDQGNGYVISTGTDGVALEYTFQWSGWQPIKFKEFRFENNQWYQLRLIADGQEISVYVDDRLMIATEDTRFDFGEFTLQVGPQTHAQFDNFQVISLDSQ